MILYVFTVTALLPTAFRAEEVFRSGAAPVALVELYTSEGCSSCPPAERWLGNLRDDSDLWKTYVPIAFHVSYWDHLGWKDMLASKAFTARQHAYADQWGAGSVYTPCFVRNGEEWRRREAPGRPSGTSPAGELTATWDSASRTCRVSFTPAATPRTETWEASVALLGGGIVNQVRRGENAGRELAHEFVVLRLETVPLQRPDAGAWEALVRVPEPLKVGATRHALAAWVTKARALTPVQATGGWLK